MKIMQKLVIITIDVVLFSISRQEKLSSSKW